MPQSGFMLQNEYTEVYKLLERAAERLENE